MGYTISVLTTVADCDMVMLEATSEKNTLTIRRIAQDSRITSRATEASLIPSQLATVVTQIAFKQSQLAAATTEMEQRELQIELNTLNSRKLRFENRLDAFEGIEQLDKQLEVAKIEAEIAVLDAYLTAIESRKADIIASSGAVA
jgi:predicted  nucleic acid-binding Zn-ribbon protein